MLLVYLFAVLAVVFFNLALFPGTLTSFAVSGSFDSNVTVENFFAIQLSANLSNGINFEEITVLPATNVNSTNNYDGVSSESTMYAEVSSDSDSSVDFCIKANTGLTDSSSGAFIGLGNETYSNSSTSDLTNPSIDYEESFTTDYVKSSAPVAPGASTYYRFWLDAPSGTSSGSYNNTISFKGVSTLTSC